jgi:hypothetical protein
LQVRPRSGFLRPGSTNLTWSPPAPRGTDLLGTLPTAVEPWHRHCHDSLSFGRRTT